jgi:hypothetical protein
MPLLVTIAMMAAAASGVVASPASAEPDHVITVGPGQSIQAAVNAANPGDTILLGPGHYVQHVAIAKEGIILKGSGSGIGGTELDESYNNVVAPANPFCPSSGVCVAGRHVRITGLRMVGYPCCGVLLAGAPFAAPFGFPGADHVRVDHVAVVNGGTGLNSLAATNVTIEDVQAGGNLTGIFMFGVPGYVQANSVVRETEVTGSNFGVVLADVHQVTVQESDIHGNCNGVSVFDSAAPGGAGDDVIRDNRVLSNGPGFAPSANPTCFEGGITVPPGLPLYFGVGLIGAAHSTVVDNKVQGNSGAGILVISALLSVGGSGAAPMNNVVADNHAVSNHVDIFSDGTGSGNVLHDNECQTSSPAGLCADG